MITLPKEIAHMIKTIEDAGYEAYAVGGCVRDTLLGKHPEDWDLTSNASRDTLEALFPDAAIVNKKLGVMRITEGEVTADIAAFRIDGEYKDYRRPETVIFTEEISEDLRRRDFTMNAIAVNPVRGVVDPYHGIEDINRKLIRGIGEPRLRFEEDALRILRGIRFAAQLDFTIEEGTLCAMQEKAGLLEHISVERIREEFQKTIMGQNGGKGLRLLKDAGAFPYLLGVEEQNLSEAELAKLNLLADNIDIAERGLDLRLALFYRCFKEEKALAAIEGLAYSNDRKMLLRCAVITLDELRQIQDKAELKKLISRIGLKSFQFLVALSEQESRVFHLDDKEFQRWFNLMKEIQRSSEPIFIGDLAVGGNDLIEVGIREGKKIGEILQLLLDLVQQNPSFNSREALLEKVKELI